VGYAVEFFAVIHAAYRDWMTGLHYHHEGEASIGHSMVCKRRQAENDRFGEKLPFIATLEIATI
jgi:hypothetical protein